MSDHNVPRPAEKFHDAKKRFDTELKQLAKTAKGKQGKEQVAAKEKEVESALQKIKEHWDIFNRAEDGDESAAQDWAVLSGEAPAAVTTQQSAPQSAHDILNGAGNIREVALSKKQQKLLQREAKEEEEAKRTKEFAATLPDLLKEENKKLSAKLKKFSFEGQLTGVKGAEIVEVAGDGHCLFRAINHQLEAHLALLGKKEVYSAYIQHFNPEFVKKVKELYGGDLNKQTTSFTVPLLRRMVSTWMAMHPDDFVPFLFESPIFERGGIEAYCNALANDTEVMWGGEPEIMAVAQLFGVKIVVIQAVGENPVYNLDGSKDAAFGPLVITFHAAWASAGAHYNGVVPAKQ